MRPIQPVLASLILACGCKGVATENTLTSVDSRLAVLRSDRTSAPTTRTLEAVLADVDGRALRALDGETAEAMATIAKSPEIHAAIAALDAATIQAIGQTLGSERLHRAVAALDAESVETAKRVLQRLDEVAASVKELPPRYDKALQGLAALEDVSAMADHLQELASNTSSLRMSADPLLASLGRPVAEGIPETRIDAALNAITSLCSSLSSLADQITADPPSADKKVTTSKADVAKESPIAFLSGAFDRMANSTDELRNFGLLKGSGLLAILAIWLTMVGIANAQRSRAEDLVLDLSKQPRGQRRPDIATFLFQATQGSFQRACADMANSYRWATRLSVIAWGIAVAALHIGRLDKRLYVSGLLVALALLVTLSCIATTSCPRPDSKSMLVRWATQGVLLTAGAIAMLTTPEDGTKPTLTTCTWTAIYTAVTLLAIWVFARFWSDESEGLDEIATCAFGEGSFADQDTPADVCSY